ncbi:MAG: hypothetical protein ACFCUV_18455 [Rivularia sp. (in: cyanobacteria)]
MQQVKNSQKLVFTAILSSSLAATIVGLVTPIAFAQQTTTSPLTVQSTGTISGTLVLPFFNPNYNKVLTRIDTDENGAYYRNIGTKQNPELVQVYKSEYVKVNVRDDGSMNYHVNFKGIPVASFDAIIKSPVLSDGEMTTFRYDGRPDMEGTVIKAVVQDEFGVKRAFYTGILTDPDTGTQYQGTFELTGQGPRYSDRNGGDSPNVFDYKSDQPGSPRSEPYKIKDDSPLVKLYINVPEGTKILDSSTAGGTSTSTGGTTSTSPGGNETSTSTGSSTSASTGGTNSTPPTTFTPPSLPITSTSPGSSTSTSTGGTNSTAPITSTSLGGTSTSPGSGTSTSTGGTNSTPPITSTSPGSSTSTSTGSSTSTSTGGTNSTASTTFTPPSLPINSTSPGSGTSTSSTPISSTASNTSTISTSSTPSISSTPSTDVSNIEFSSGNSFVANSVLEKSSNIGNKSDENISQSKQRGPRSRVMIR